MPRVNFNDERGSAVLEFVGFGLLFQIVILMATLQIAELQKNQIAAESIARHSLRSFVIAATPIETTAQQIVTDFGVNQKPILQLSCNPDCETPGALASLRVLLSMAVAQSTMRIE